MQDNCLLEIFLPDFSFLSKALIQAQKYEFDYMSIGNVSLTIPGFIEAYKRNYICINREQEKITGIITLVEHKATETKINYKSFLSILDVDVYKERSELAKTTAECFLGDMIIENFINNEDKIQNIQGLSVNYLSEMVNATLNLTDNVHNIYELSLKAFRKYGIVIDIEMDIMGKRLVCTIGKRNYLNKTIEADLKNIIEVSIVLKNDEESVNKAIIIGEYDEDNPLYGQTITRTYYLDKSTGLTTQTPAERMEPVIFRHKVITIDPETFENDAYEEAYDLIYREECDNSIKVKVAKRDTLYKSKDFHIGQPCTIIKNGERYKSIYTGYKVDASMVTLLFGMSRVEYTKNMRRKSEWQR